MEKVFTKDNRTYHIICDESRQTKDRFMVLGGLIIDFRQIEKFNNTMNKYRNDTNMKAELKWSKVSNQKYQEYKKFIDFFFALNNTNILHFKSLIIDTHQLDHKKYNKGDREIGFYKFYYQLLLHSFAKNYTAKNNITKYIVKLDDRNTSYKLRDLKAILNNGCKKNHISYDETFVSIEATDSKKSELMQINDLLIGSIGYIKNGFHLLPYSKKAKIDLANYILEKAGILNYDTNTPLGQKRYAVWNFKLRK